MAQPTVSELSFDDRGIRSGIDYGLGRTNIDEENGIRYGVIHSNELSSGAWDSISSQGKDMDYEDAIQGLTDNLANAVKAVLEDYSCRFDQQEIAKEIIDGLDFEFESTGDCIRYLFSDERVTFNTCGDGDIFVTKSVFYTPCDYCSPCAPGAGYLLTPGRVKAYCLGPDWFDEGVPPYPVYRVSDDSLFAAAGVSHE